MHVMNEIFHMKLFLYNHYLVSSVSTDGLVIYHQAISSHGAKYMPIHFQLFNVEFHWFNTSTKPTGMKRKQISS